MITAALTLAAQSTTLATQNNPFADHHFAPPAWIAAVPAISYVTIKWAWTALKRKTVAEHLSALPKPAVQTSIASNSATISDV